MPHTRQRPHKTTIMSHPAVTYEDDVQLIGVLPSLEPRLTSTNIRTMAVNLVDKLISLPSHQIVDRGYAGMTEQNKLYALRTNIAWVPTVDPGPRATVDSNAIYDTNCRSQIIYTSAK